jgi:mRNA-degrading endonuclease YafQ of YafQ-DinJ toxin-antitoxin module
MKALQYTGQFKKDLKKIQHHPKRIAGLMTALKIEAIKKQPQSYEF